MALVGIVAIDRNRAIGRGGELPWHYSADLKFFRAQTTGHVCVMGSHTWRSLKKPLPNRMNVVLSRSGAETPSASALFVPDRESVLSLAEYVQRDVFVIGGAGTYQTFAADISRWIVTEIPLVIEDADTFMPDDFLTDFALTDSHDLGEGLMAKFLERKVDRVD
jgi:dihydrofolate reductase